MSDVFTKAKRSEVMSRIRGRGNKDTELALAGLLRANRISGWRRHVVVRATVESSRLRVERSKQSHTSPKTLTPSPSPIRWARVASDSPQRGEGAQRQRIAQPSTTNPQLIVRPDFVFRKLRTVIFVDGCFWHRCPKHATRPKNNGAFWRRKLAGNQARDALVTRTLQRAGWRVLRVWEHELARKNQARLLRRVQRALTTDLR